ncbi:unnamed protein product, partial [Brassica oleracea]
ESPHAETLPSLSPPFATAENCRNRRLLSFVFVCSAIIVFLSTRRSRSCRPRRNRSPDEPARASESFADRARDGHAQPPEKSSPPLSPPSSAASPPSPLVTDTGDSPVTRSTRPSQLNESTRMTRLTGWLAGLN